MTKLHTTPASIAAALRRAADDIERMGDVEFSPVSVQLNLQAVSHRGASAERKAAVDVLGRALTGVGAQTEKGRNAQHAIPVFTPRLGDDDMDVNVYAGVKDFRAGGAK